jgi:DNA-binding NarL/FixJ family response regulator
MSDDSQVLRILCVDDHPLIRKGIASILANEPNMQLVAEAEDGEQAVRLFRELRPDITLMDLRMPGLDGLAATRAIRSEFPEARIIALTSYDGDQDVYRALEAGVRGYLLKETVHTDVLHAIRIVQAGKRFMPPDVAALLTEHFPEAALTPREIEVLALVADGLGNREIADRLGRATGTIKIHIENILDKLGAADRTQAVTIAIHRGILHLARTR